MSRLWGFEVMFRVFGAGYEVQFGGLEVGIGFWEYVIVYGVQGTRFRLEG